MENYKVFILKDGPFFWDGRKWVDSPQSVRCYCSAAEANAVLVVAKKGSMNPQIVEATLKL